MRFSALFSLVLFLAAAVWAQAARAQGASSADAVLLEADRMGYDQNEQLIIATGNVSVSQGDRVMMADKLLYYQARNIVKAEGNVSMLEPDGSVYFAEAVELEDNMKRGVVQEIQARLADDSLMSARSGTKLSETVSEMVQAVYSPCNVLCEDGSPKVPMWQLKASKVKIDNEAQTIQYRDARMEVYGLPFIYTPYFSHPAPGADNKSGLLTPEYSQDENLGSTFRVPMYVTMGADRDMTITPIITAKEGVVMAGEYRQQFDNGVMVLQGSATNPQDRDALGQEASGNAFRGHILGGGRFSHSKDTLWGFNVARTTDDTYLRRYKFNNYDTLLTSKLYGETYGFMNSNRNFAGAQALAFQGLTAQDDNDRSPFVLPLAEASYESTPFANGARFQMSGNMLGLSRETGPDTRRLSTSAGFILPYNTSGGHLFELSTKLRADAYYVSGDVTTVRNDNYTKYRAIPEASIGWRYPLMRPIGEESHLLIEPLVNVIASPNGGNSLAIPNEDSAIVELNDTNIFSANRFSGLDRVEQGPRANYGFRSVLDVGEDRQLSFMLGQHYQIARNDSFPISKDVNTHFSDYIARLGVTMNPVDISYRVRLNKDGLSPARQELDANLYFESIQITNTYLKLRDDAVLSDREELLSGVSVPINDVWTLSANARRDLQLNKFTNAGVGAVFQNECLRLNLLAQRDFTQDRDIKENTAVYFQIGLKNLE